MGYSADAELVYGVPIAAYDEEGEPTPFWDGDGDGDDWIDLEAMMLKLDGVNDPSDEVPRELWHGYDSAAFDRWEAEHPEWRERLAAWYAAKRALNLNVEIVTYGHYEQPDGPRAILSPTRLKRHSCSCWEQPREIGPDALSISDKALSKATDDCRVLGLDVSFYAGGSWWLVASYG